MLYTFRKGATSGVWCSLLVPFCLLPCFFQFASKIHLLLHLISVWSCFSFFLKENLCPISSFPVFYGTVSIPISLLVWYFSAIDFFCSYLLCLAAVCYYNHLISTLLIKCPGSFSLGEVHVITQCVQLFLVGFSFLFYSELDVPHSSEIPEWINCLLVLVLGCIFLLHSLILFPVIRQGICFVIFCSLLSAIMMVIWNQLFSKNVFLWLWLFCTHHKTRIYLMLFWIASVLASIVLVLVANFVSTHKATTITRKYFHLIINAVFIPGVFVDIELVKLASGIALTFFVLLEAARLLNLAVIGSAIGNAFSTFLDEKDSGILILTHIYLLIGCSSSIWLSLDRKEHHICLLSGIISVGFGDTAAAVGGKCFGKRYWRGSKKTYEGSLCALLAQLLSAFFFIYLWHKFTISNVLIVILAAVLTTYLEAKTSQVDNLVLPLFMFMFLSWIV